MVDSCRSVRIRIRGGFVASSKFAIRHLATGNLTRDLLGRSFAGDYLHWHPVLSGHSRGTFCLLSSDLPDCI
jgi:hypothetical protein